MAAPKQIVFDDFTGGDYGRDWPSQTDPTKFRAVNVIQYPGGWIGPRQPLVEFQLPDVADQPAFSEDNTIWFVDNNLLIGLDGYIWYVPTGQRSVSPADDVTHLRDYHIGAFGELVAVSDDTAETPHTAISVQVGGSTDTVPQFIDVTDPDAPDGGLRSEMSTDVVVFTANRQYYWCESLNFAGWDVADVSNIYIKSIYDLINQKNTTVFLAGSLATANNDGIFNQLRGIDTPQVDIYVLYGTLGADATLRKVDTGPAPVRTSSGSFIWSVAGDIVYWIFDRWLMAFDGSEVTQLDAPLPRAIHDVSDVPIGPDTVIQFWDKTNSRAQGEYILAGSLGVLDEGDEQPDVRRGFFNWYGGKAAPAWTAHDPGIQYNAEYDEDYPGAGIALRGNGNFYVWQQGESDIVFTTQGRKTDNVETPRFFRMDLRPSFPTTDADDGDTGAPVEADFYTADYWAGHGEEVAVRAVTIEYAYTPNDDQATNQAVTVQVEALGLWEDDRPRASAAVSFSPPAGVAQDSGSAPVRGRKRFSFGEQATGNGFRIHLSDWSGIAIRRIICDVNVVPSRAA